MALSKEARDERNKYMREYMKAYRMKKVNKIIQNNEKYWEKRANKLKGEK